MNMEKKSEKSSHLQVIGPHERQDWGNGEVGDEDDDQRQVDGERNGTFRILRLFTWKNPVRSKWVEIKSNEIECIWFTSGGDGIESDESEEARGRPRHDAGKSVRKKSA